MLQHISLVGIPKKLRATNLLKKMNYVGRKKNAKINFEASKWV